MFRGSVPPDMQRILAGIVRDWSCQRIHIACSGNFTVERVLSGTYDDRFRMHSNDVTLYSSAIGAYFAGDNLPVTLNPQYAGEFGYIEPYLDSPADRLASILICSRLAQALDRDNPYYRRMREAHLVQWDAMHQKTVDKIRSVEMHLDSYDAEDMYTWIDRVPDDAGIITYPPFFGASKDYEHFFAKLEKLLVWLPPSFEPLDDERIRTVTDKIIDRKYWLFGVPHRIERLEKFLRGMARTTNRGVPIYVYASEGTRRISVPNQAVGPFAVPHLQPTDDLGLTLHITALTGDQFSLLRSKYMNHGIIPGSATLPVAVMVDGILIGVFAFSSAPSMAQWDTHVQGPYIYLLSDFPVANTKYRHMAKLVLYAALSKEAKLLAECSARKRIRSVVTTAYTQRPVSMKYRGLFRLLTRKDTAKKDHGLAEGSSNSYYSQKFELNYGSDAGRWTLAEGFAEWMTRYGKELRNGDTDTGGES